MGWVVECAESIVDLFERQILRLRWRELPRTHVLVSLVAWVCTGMDVWMAHATADGVHK